jgi:hypothetical protein
MKTKSIIIIVATLIIGFVTGFLVNGQLTKGRIQKFVKQGTHDGFKMRFFDIIRPDEAQKIAIEPILEAYAVKTHETAENFREEMKARHDEMIKKLEPYLKEDQLLRLKDAQERFERHERMRPGAGPGPDSGMEPPPGMEPPRDRRQHQGW